MSRYIDKDEFLKSEIERCGCVPVIGSCTADNESLKTILEQTPTIKTEDLYGGRRFIFLDDVYRVIAGHSNYHGDNILSALTCIAEGKEVKPVKPLEDIRPKWISVEERLPENEEDVLICVEKRSGGKVVRKMVCTAFYTDGTSNTEDSFYSWSCDYIDMDYDEEKDAYIIPEGWWESVFYGEEFSAIDDFVTHWMPFPEPPAE